MKTKIATSNAAAVAPLFESMTREELAATAKALGVSVGKSRANTIANLNKAIAAQKAQVKAVYTVSFKPADGSASRVTFFGRTLRTYVSGPGLGNDTWLMPSAAVTGSPTDKS
jgi:histidyl-tRNA synthetase